MNYAIHVHLKVINVQYAYVLPMHLCTIVGHCTVKNVCQANPTVQWYLVVPFIKATFDFFYTKSSTTENYRLHSVVGCKNPPGKVGVRELLCAQVASPPAPAIPAQAGEGALKGEQKQLNVRQMSWPTRWAPEKEQHRSSCCLRPGCSDLSKPTKKGTWHSGG